ncbi:unnamed protein product [Symbiodinium natans]|uniref:Uncharacterized protein n=1 Tax=Symbiodinium natans TaxID=878477 RepID=A0A812SAG5_9DINO|nr:unnamed protein product [Symbiodinium natans]
MALPRLEVLAFLGALLLQGAYVLFYDAFKSYVYSGDSNNTGSVIEALDERVVEVREFLSADCDGPPARLWHVVPTPGPAQCLALRPQMQKPGKKRGEPESASPLLYGRVSCDMLRHADGGFVDICSDEDCSEEGCQRISIVPEGECGSSFTGFAGASWRCIQSSDMPK